MARNALPILALLTCIGAAACTRQGAATTSPDAGMVFQPDAPAVYVAKVKNILVGLPPTDDEVAQVTADPSALGKLVDGWMATPEYQDKMMVFFELAFQQTQITAADFTDSIPPQGLGVGGQIPLLLQNIRESFARTVLSLVTAGRPITDAFTTHQLMMTPALMELYAFLDTRRLDDNAKVADALVKNNPMLKSVTVEASLGPIAIADTLNPASTNYMHWYNPNVGKLTGYNDPTCNSDPIVLPADSYDIHELLYGAIGNHRTMATPAASCPTQATTGFQMAATDFTTWKLITIRAPKTGETPTAFFDLPTLRSATEVVISTPRPGFFSTPAFGANWPTNTSNQMRVTLNQMLIVATGMAIDGNDTTTMAPTTTGMDLTHAAIGSPCFGCHQLLDPTRAMLQNTYSYYYYPQAASPYPATAAFMFAFQGVVTPVKTIDDFASTMATHPAVPSAWAQKLCYWVNSSACATDDPEFKRVVGVFANANLSWNALVHELVTSPITTNTVETRTTAMSGEVIAVTRRDHLCAALNNRLGLVDVCGLDAVNTKRTMSVVPQIVSGLPSDGYGRGSPIPVLPNQPTLFYRAGLENICETVAGMVIDAKANANQPNAKSWSSAQPDAAIADFVSTVMALTSSDPRAAGATQILKSHFTTAQQQGATASDALKSTFVTACLAPSSIGIGM
ncbi:MAG TPA: hypothetical protein VHB97_07455 [Polyangia bacterium]|nr:hypothetical protein [Polyangia bacterium]